jgi:hypothetical protein
MTAIRRFLMQLLALAVLSSSLAISPAYAGLVGTDQLLPAEQSDRDRVKALVARPEVARKLENLGVLPKDAAARIDALTDAEVATLAARIDALPAGGLTDQNWLLIIIVILLVLIIL